VEILTRPLPKRLAPAESYETWVPVGDIPEGENVFEHFFAMLSTGEVFTSRENVDVRPRGFVAGT
jgi:hypothetical protein